MWAVIGVVGSICAFFKAKALLWTRRAGRLVQGPQKIIDLLSARFPDHEFFEEELGIWVSGPTFPWQSGLYQRHAHWRNGDVREYPWTLLQIDPETTMVPRRRIITPQTLQPFLNESQQRDAVGDHAVVDVDLATGWVTYRIDTDDIDDRLVDAQHHRIDTDDIDADDLRYTSLQDAA